eukprot:3492478-Rhodomonas_salina.1
MAALVHSYPSFLSKLCDSLQLGDNGSPHPASLITPRNVNKGFVGPRAKGGPRSNVFWLLAFRKSKKRQNRFV